MKEIVKLGLVMSVLLCVAIGAASAQEEPSEEYMEGYKAGFYEGGLALMMAYMDGSDLENLYNYMGGEPTTETIVYENETVTLSDYYNEQATYFNEVTANNLNSFILQIFGSEDDRTKQLLLPELKLIS